MHNQNDGQEPQEARRDELQEDARLIQQAQEGNQQAFEALLRRHERRVFALIGSFLRRRQDVEDLAQEVFLKAYLAMGRFRPGAPFAPWLNRIAVNACYDHLRKNRRRPEVSLADLEHRESEFIHRFAGRGYLSAGGQGGDPVAAKDLAERILATLPPRDRLAITLREVHGFEIREVASALGCTQPAAKVRLFRARRVMQATLERLIQQEEQVVRSTGGGQDDMS